MKLLIISIIKKDKTQSQGRYRGFMMIEIMLAFSLFTIFTISIYSLTSSFQSMKIWSLKELSKLENSVHAMDSFASSTTLSMYGNDSQIFTADPFSATKSNLIDSWGGSTCSPRIDFDQSKITLYPQGVFLGTGNSSTDVKVKNSIAYLTSDSSTLSQPDFFIVDAHNPESPGIISSLQTGPGLSAITVAGPYAYVANTSSLSQLQIIDMSDRMHPFILSQIKIPLPTASTTAPIASSIFYKNGFVYLGTNKWNGPELSIVDVSNPLSPVIVGNFETNTLINDIYINKNTVYLATSDSIQMRVLDISDKTNPISVFSFSPSGRQTQEGKALEYFEQRLGLGRTVGGFNNVSNHEAFIFATSSNTDFVSSDISGGVYGLLFRFPNIFLLSHSPGHEFQVFSSTLQTKIFDMSLGSEPVKMACDWSNLFFATGNSQGLVILYLK